MTQFFFLLSFIFASEGGSRTTSWKKRSWSSAELNMRRNSKQFCQILFFLSLFLFSFEIDIGRASRCDGDVTSSLFYLVGRVVRVCRQFSYLGSWETDGPDLSSNRANRRVRYRNFTARRNSTLRERTDKSLEQTTVENLRSTNIRRINILRSNCRLPYVVKIIEDEHEFFQKLF